LRRFVVVGVFAEKKCMANPIKVSIVDDDDVFRQGMRAWLESADGITVVGEARDGQQAITLIRETRPDVVLLDIGTRHASSLQAVAQVCAWFPQTRIIVLHDAGQEELVLDALRQGALGHLVKGKIQPAGVVQAVRAVSRGEAILSPDIAGCILNETAQKRKVG
jgi:DNA-binding NarL/FixJ family response regulator